jgi:hypothetical protein
MEYRVKTGATFYTCKPWEVLIPEIQFNGKLSYGGKWFVAQVPTYIREPGADTNSTKLVAVHETGNLMEVTSIDTAKKEVRELLQYDKELFLWTTTGKWEEE